MSEHSMPRPGIAPSSSAISQFFDQMALDRNAIFRARPVLNYEQQARSQAVLRLLAATAGETILDIGCGNARDIPPILDAHARVVGVDLAPGMIDQAKTDLAMAGYHDVELQVGDATALTFMAGSFDKILCSEVIEHVPDADRAVQEMSRVLRAGGSLVISTPNRRSWYGFDRFVIWNRLLTKPWNHPFDNWRDMTELSDLLERHGFRIATRLTVCYLPGFLLTYRLPRFLQAGVVGIVRRMEPLLSKVAPRRGYLLVVSAVKTA